LSPIRRFLLLLSMSLLAWSSRAVANEAEDRARALYATGKSAFEAGHYEEAEQQFRAAYLLAHAPGLLYNMGMALELAGRPHDAAEALRAYLRAENDAPSRAPIEARIRGLEEAQRLLDSDRLRAQPPALRDLNHDLDLQQHHERKKRLAIGLGVGLGVVVVGVALGLGLGLGLRSAPTASTLGTQRATP
jgi:tetratricopeptide (TPR) repeat protein